MRKSSRILSILLVACMLISAMVVAVSAAISTTPTTPSGATGSITPKPYTMGPTGNASNTSNNCITDSSNGIANGSHVHASATCTYGGTLFNAEDFIKPGGYKYATVDFDVMSDGYLKTEGDVISVDKEATSGKLAYRENIHISALLNGSGVYTHFAYFVSNGDNWYLSADNAYSEDDVALATEKNVWNHITMVDDGANVYLYLDGEFVSKTATKLSGKRFCRIGLDVSGIAKEDAIKTGYSIKVNNVVANKYSADYVSGAAFGLDDYITAADFTAPLYSCADVVYNSNYIYDNAVAGQDAVTVTYADKSVENYQNVPAFYAAASKMSESKLEGASIVSRRSLLSLALPSGIADITVTVLGNAKLTVSKATLYMVDEETKTADGTTYTFKEINLQDAINATKLATINEAAKNFVKNGFAYEYDKSTGKLAAFQDLKLYASYDVVGAQNKYQHVLPIANPNPTKDAPKLAIDYGSVKGDGFLGNHDYTVIDFDIATQSLFFSSEVASIAVGIFPTSSYTYFAHILRDANNNFYVSADNTLDVSKDVQIPVDGVWSHISVVIKTNDADKAKSEAHLYLNGAYIGTTVINISGSKGLRIFAIELSGLTKTEAATAKYDFCVDNVAINYYTEGYDAANGDTANTLTSFFKADDYKTKSLLTLNDVIYNEAYANGGYTVKSDWDNVVVDLAIGEDTTSFASLAEAEVAISAMSAADLNGATIYSRVDIDADKLLPAGVNDVKIICNGATATGGTNYRLMAVQTEIGPCYVIDCLTVAGEGITNVGYITTGKEITTDHNNGTIGYGYCHSNFTKSGTVGLMKSFISGGLVNEYQQIMNDGKHADVNTGNKFLNNNSQIWFGINDVKLSDNKYITVDFDFASDKYLDDGALSDTGSELAYVNKMNFMLFNATGIAGNLYIINNNGAWYASADQNYDANDVPLAKEAGVWNHFTYVMSESGKIYVFVDGKFVTSYSRNNGETIRRIVVNTNGLAYTAFSYAFDNVSINKYALGGEYGLDTLFADDTYKTSSLYNVEDVVYNKNYKYYGFVDGQYAATVTDKEGNEKNYFFLEGALENLADGVTIESRKNIPALDPEDSIESYTIITKLGATMAKPADKYYKISKTVDGTTTTYVLSRVGEDELVIVNWIIGDKTFDEISDVKGSELTIADEILAEINALVAKTKGTYKWEMNLGDGFAFVDSLIVPETYTSKDPVTVRIAAITVTWLDGAGEVYATESWFAGNEITPYDITGLSNVEITGNGWYNIDYTTWETAGMDMLNNKFVAEALTPMTFTAKKTPIPAFTEAKLNMSLLTKFEANLYITNRPLANITLGGIFSDAELTDNIIDTLKLAEVDGKSFYLDNFFFDNSDVDRVVSRYLNYTVVYNGQEYALVDEIQVSLLDYAEKVLAQYGCGSEEANLAYNLINYANAAYALKTGVDYEEAVAFLALDGHEEGCACFATHDKADEEVCVGENSLGENVVGWSFDVSNEQPAFVVYVKVDEFDNALVEDIELAFFGINGTDVTDVAVKLVRGENVEAGDEVYATFFFEDMPLYNAAEIFTLTVTDATTGEVYVANYSLATYIDFAIHEELDADALKVAEALYSFAKVAKDYKLN